MDLAEARRVVDDVGWARIVTNGPDGLRATYGFVLVEESAADEIVVSSHFARADPQSADIEARVPVLLIVDGPYGFVSASWYAPDLTALPSTMNHISVHLHGTPEPLEGDERFAVLRRTIERNEAPLGEAGWKVEGAGEAKSHDLAPHTVCFRLRATRVEAKAKLSQGMSRPIRERVVAGLEADGPLQNPALAELMHRLSFLHDP